MAEYIPALVKQLTKLVVHVKLELQFSRLVAWKGHGHDSTDKDIYTGKEIETFPAHISELKKLFPHSNIQLIIVYPIGLS